MNEVTPADKLGLFTVGMGAVATTLFAGVELTRRHGRIPVGSYTQLGWLTDATGQAGRVVERVPLAPLPALEFGGVDLIEPDALTAARTAGVLNAADLATVADFLASITAGPGLHDASYVRALPAIRARPEKNKAVQSVAMQQVYREFLARRGCARGVVLLTLSTEAWRPLGAVHASMAAFLAGLILWLAPRGESRTAESVAVPLE